MKVYLRKYRLFFIFLVKFFLVYGVLLLVYNYYLQHYDATRNEVDGFTVIVATQTKELLSFFDVDAMITADPFSPSVRLFIHKYYIAKIVEGCNAVSIMILFAAFVIAFSGRWYKTAVFIGLGILGIHCFNILRIALLGIALYRYPEYTNMLHGVVFPLAIYGAVFLLWYLWIAKFSDFAGDGK